MKIRNLAFLFVLGLFVASCTDKAAQDEIVKMKEDMAAADSLCQADKQMLMDSVAKIQMMMDSIMNPPNRTSSGSGTKSSTTSTTSEEESGKTVNKRGGDVDKTIKKGVNDRGGDAKEDVKKDVNDRGGL
jgi:hypothetical protein